MKFDKNLAAIHGYLCGDGYVITNPKDQKHKYYHIGFRNTNKELLEDFQRKFQMVFGFKPYITNEGRCRIQNKEIYFFLTKKFSYYSYEWQLPTLSNNNLKFWLRVFFDCEGWVENQPRKSRLIGLDCCNQKGLLTVQNALKKFWIKTQIKKKVNRTIWRLTICGLDDLNKFQSKVGFLHPEKKLKLNKTISSYVDYNWKILSNKEDLLKLIKEKGKLRKERSEIRFLSIKKENLQNLKKALNKHNINSRLLGPWTSSTCSQYYCLTIKEEHFNERTKNWTSSRNQKN
ncbi:MAG: LAGLIDADG family homing endonuclease [Candidatus Woesearchaeota archaeon]